MRNKENKILRASFFTLIFLCAVGVFMQSEKALASEYTKCTATIFPPFNVTGISMPIVSSGGTISYDYYDWRYTILFDEQCAIRNFNRLSFSTSNVIDKALNLLPGQSYEYDANLGLPGLYETVKNVSLKGDYYPAVDSGVYPYCKGTYFYLYPDPNNPHDFLFPPTGGTSSRFVTVNQGTPSQVSFIVYMTFNDSCVIKAMGYGGNTNATNTSVAPGGVYDFGPLSPSVFLNTTPITWVCPSGGTPLSIIEGSLRPYVTCYTPPVSITDSATCTASTVTSPKNVGEPFTATTITCTNNGTTTWDRTLGYELGSQNAPNNMTWGLSRIELPIGTDSVAPGASVTFTGNFTAPPTSGTYNYQWQMLREGIAWFGTPTPNQSIDVAVLCTETRWIPNENTYCQGDFKDQTGLDCGGTRPSVEGTVGPIANSCNPQTNGKSFTTAPTQDLCFYPSFPPLTETSTGWSWVCPGICGGASSSTCTATKTSLRDVGDYIEVR